MKQRAEDPVLVSARREALVVLGMWLAAFLWTIGYCGLYAYDVQANPPLVLGVPAWVMWGIFVPWTLCTVASTLLAWLFMSDADLGEDRDEAGEVGDG